MGDTNTVAVLGLGIMGSAMARRLLDAGMQVRVWNRHPEKMEPLVAAGAVGARTPKEAAEGASVALTMLSDAHALEAVVEDGDGLLAGLTSDALWLQMSTIGVTATAHFLKLATEHHTPFVDAPVLGTKGPAEKGELVVLASGPDAQRGRCAPIFDAVGRKTLWVGDVAGAGSRLKLVVNEWLTGLVALLAESLAVAESVNVDPSHFFEAIEGGPLFAPFAGIKGQLIRDGNFEAQFPLKHALKDVRLLVEAARRHGFEPFIAEAVANQYAKAQELGHGDDDMAAVFLAMGR